MHPALFVLLSVVLAGAGIWAMACSSGRTRGFASAGFVLQLLAWGVGIVAALVPDWPWWSVLVALSLSGLIRVDWVQGWLLLFALSFGVFSLEPALHLPVRIEKLIWIASALAVVPAVVSVLWHRLRGIPFAKAAEAPAAPAATPAAPDPVLDSDDAQNGADKYTRE